MKTIKKTEPMVASEKWIQEIFTEQSLFFDIETTGFSGNTTMVYLIGTAYRKGSTIFIHQFFAEKKEDEADLICAFSNLEKEFKNLITFNGNGFDIPYLKKRCGHLSLDLGFDNVTSLDIYKAVQKIWHILPMVDKKQKTIEQFLGIGRKDLFHGGELIEVYYDYLKTGDDKLEKFLLLHNYEDILGMTKLLPVLSYFEALKNNIPCVGVELSGEDEIIFTFQSPYLFPKQVSCHGRGCYLTCFKNKVKILVKIYHGELYYFYSDYKEYYYLPEEDMAIHKSVAEYVDKGHRQKAKASNCYTRRSGDFLPLFSPMETKCFRKDYKSKERYMELTQEMCENKEMLMEYARHLKSAFYDKVAL